MCILNNVNDSNNYTSFAYGYDTPDILQVEDMFPPYVSFQSNDDNQMTPERNESSGLY